jgi:hypothetical protein
MYLWFFICTSFLNITVPWNNTRQIVITRIYVVFSRRNTSLPICSKVQVYLTRKIKYTTIYGTNLYFLTKEISQILSLGVEDILVLYPPYKTRKNNHASFPGKNIFLALRHGSEFILSSIKPWFYYSSNLLANDFNDF